MDMATLGAALAKAGLPAATEADVGKVATVGADGKWGAGAVTDATITVSGTTLTITAGGE